MCTGSARGLIVVGVDDRAESLNAARYAIEQASAFGLCIRLVHAYGSPVGYGQYGALNLGRMERTADALVSTLLARVDVPEGVCVERMIDNGSPVDALTRAGDDARFVVIGRRLKYLAPRLLRRHVASRLSARAPVPVLTVPATRRFPDQCDRPVVVGLDDAAMAGPLLAFAFAQADQQRTDLLVVRAVRDDHDAEYTGTWQALTPWRARYPDVAVDLEVSRGGAEGVLTRASADASMLVVGRPSEDPGFGTWWGSSTTALVSRAPCPIAVVPKAFDDTRAGPAHAGDNATRFDTNARS